MYLMYNNQPSARKYAWIFAGGYYLFRKRSSTKAWTLNNKSRRMHGFFCSAQFSDLRYFRRKLEVVARGNTVSGQFWLCHMTRLDNLPTRINLMDYKLQQGAQESPILIYSHFSCGLIQSEVNWMLSSASNWIITTGRNVN